MRAQKPAKGGIITESFGTEVTTGPEQEEMPIHAHLSQSNYYLIVLLGHKLMRLHLHRQRCRQHPSGEKDRDGASTTILCSALDQERGERAPRPPHEGASASDQSERERERRSIGVPGDQRSGDR